MITRREIFKKLVLAPIALVASAPIIKVVHDRYLADGTWILCHNVRPHPTNEGKVLKFGEDGVPRWVDPLAHHSA